MTVLDETLTPVDDIAHLGPKENLTVETARAMSRDPAAAFDAHDVVPCRSALARVSKSNRRVHG